MLLPLTLGVLAILAPVLCSPCALLEESTTLHCLSPLVTFADIGSQALHPPLSDVHELCIQYTKYQICTAGVSQECKSSIAPNVDKMYSILCEDKFSTMLREERECMVVLEKEKTLKECFLNGTNSLRDERSPISSSNDTADYECTLFQIYVDCLIDKEDQVKQCKEAVKLQVSLLSMLASRSDDNLCYITITPKKMPGMEICPLDGGNCSCKVEGYVYDNALKKCIDIDECSDFTSGCSQYCTNLPGSFECACDEEYYRLAPNNRTCERKTNDVPWIFFAHGQSIWNISTDGKSFQLQRAGLQKTAMLDVDVRERRLYYADIGANSIERMNIDGTFPQSVQKYEVEGLEGIAVDWVGRNLYSLRRTDIVVQTLDGRFRRSLYKDVMRLPRAIVLHPKKGMMIVSDWSSSAFIAVAAMDGSSFRKIVTERITWPNALAVDIHSDKVYWADAFLDAIEVANLDGSGRRVVVSDAGSVPHVFGMAVADDFLYWTDWTYRGLLRANKLSGDNITVLAQTALLPYSLRIFDKSLQPDVLTDCTTKSCSQLCLIGVNATSRCLCGEGFRLLDDGKTCQSDCEPGFIECGGADAKCISKLYMCDGVPHCSNHADEASCPPRICLPGQFQCHDNKKCVSPGGLCDGVPDCADKSDESYCHSKREKRDSNRERRDLHSEQRDADVPDFNSDQEPWTSSIDGFREIRKRALKRQYNNVNNNEEWSNVIQ